ncbi:derlin KNAG_0A03730 [Huiozyma naganishii CBS 8797]|uniref:Derlin n=1 Tax=Huiozyma naganishii (strain ATCC MYA-139 / BCRC 22969 / CBS 8797 / KCTC 17520 / NBRC 10181 / NCYC 3082 / Yp74L-3) TaxID=1071383 RepID=J7RER9_HUIN7|nr:hypothetical protein KNAG_0A03730 [Kazachstania naganishii CBS 8797]CCK68053.1 hypothetical protein KNAG_0A03730 [Kazachstania naganishii CBS 8797]
MDAIIFNIFGDLPIITKSWVLGSVAVSVVTSTGIVDGAKTLYNYDLVFHRGQYQRILYSLFNFGELSWVSMINIFITANHLTILENSLTTKRRFLWMMFLMLSCILIMSVHTQPTASLGSILHENLLYYIFKKSGNQMNIPIFGGNELMFLILPLYMYGMMYFVMKKSLFEISMNFLPAHIIYYCDNVFHKLYNIDLCKTPYDIWKDWGNEERNRE